MPQFNAMPEELRPTTKVGVKDYGGDPKCTLVSIAAFRIREEKPGIYPGRFVIDKCEDVSKPKTLVIGTSIYFVNQYVGDKPLPPIIIPTSSHEMARSIIQDYFHSQLLADSDGHPGLTFLPGVVTPEEFIVKCADLHRELVAKQTVWYGRLVSQADDDYMRYKRNTVISDIQRHAARDLKLNRDWLMPTPNEVQIECPACKTDCKQDALICYNCKCPFSLDESAVLNWFKTTFATAKDEKEEEKK